MSPSSRLGWRGRGRVKSPSGPYYTRVTLPPTHRPRSRTTLGYFRSCCLVGSILSSLIKTTANFAVYSYGAQKVTMATKLSTKENRDFLLFFMYMNTIGQSFKNDFPRQYSNSISLEVDLAQFLLLLLFCSLLLLLRIIFLLRIILLLRITLFLRIIGVLLIIVTKSLLGCN